MESQITASEARKLVAIHNRTYTEICRSIEQAANNGETEVTVENIICHKIRAKLSDDNFDLTCNKEKEPGKFSYRIWWGNNHNRQ